MRSQLWRPSQLSSNVEKKWRLDATIKIKFTGLRWARSERSETALGEHFFEPVECRYAVHRLYQFHMRIDLLALDNTVSFASHTLTNKRKKSLRVWLKAVIVLILFDEAFSVSVQRGFIYNFPPFLSLFRDLRISHVCSCFQKRYQTRTNTCLSAFRDVVIYRRNGGESKQKRKWRILSFMWTGIPKYLWWCHAVTESVDSTFWLTIFKFSSYFYDVTGHDTMGDKELVSVSASTETEIRFVPI